MGLARSRLGLPLGWRGEAVTRFYFEVNGIRTEVVEADNADHAWEAAMDDNPDWWSIEYLGDQLSMPENDE